MCAVDSSVVGNETMSLVCQEGHLGCIPDIPPASVDGTSSCAMVGRAQGVDHTVMPPDPG